MRVNISVLIEYGAYAPQVFEDVKKAVVKQVTGMTGLEVAGVNLRIEDVLTPEEIEQRSRRAAAASKKGGEGRGRPPSSLSRGPGAEKEPLVRRSERHPHDLALGATRFGPQIEDDRSSYNPFPADMWERGSR